MTPRRRHPSHVIGEPPPAPAGGRGPDDRFYATRLKQLVHLDLDETEAEVLWRQAAEHREELGRRLGRDVGQHVALLDFIVNIRPRLEEPRIIERTALEAIEHQAIADSLTGLHNRWYFDAALKREVERCRRYRLCSSLLLLDLDHFKEINDRLGHLVGDAVLRRVGRLLQSYMRGADVACRIGGDEFAVILTDTGEGEALRAAQRIRDGIEASFRRGSSSSVWQVTATAGIAVMTPEVTRPEEVLREADRTLYQGKRARKSPDAATDSRAR